MTSNPQDGRTTEAIFLNVSKNVVRLAAKGTDNVAVFRKVQGSWVSEECEPVIFTLAKKGSKVEVTFSDKEFICSVAFASRLIDVLLQ